MRIRKIPVNEFINKEIYKIPKKNNALIIMQEWPDGKDYFSKIKYKNPLSLPDAIINARQIFDNAFLNTPYTSEELGIIWRFLKKTKKFIDEKVTAVVVPGKNSTVLELSKGKALKMSKEHPFMARNYIENLDIPIISPVEVYTEKGRDYYFYIQAKADMTLTTPDDVKDVIKTIRKNNLTPFDIWASRTDQVGIYKKKPYLVDSECAQ